MNAAKSRVLEVVHALNHLGIDAEMEIAAEEYRVRMPDKSLLLVVNKEKISTHARGYFGLNNKGFPLGDEQPRHQASIAGVTSI